MKRKNKLIKGIGRVTEPSQNRGVALLDEVLDVIVQSPEVWEQGAYRCGTGMCVAGWACQLAGGIWAADAKSTSAYMLLATADDDPATLSELNGYKVVPAWDRAQRLLELTKYQASSLFEGTNDLDDIKRQRDSIAARARV